MAASPFPPMLRLPEQAKDICDGDHGLELFGSPGKTSLRPTSLLGPCSRCDLLITR
jgi:hypothetical protein